MKTVMYEGPADQLEQDGRTIPRGVPTEVPNDFPVSKVTVIDGPHGRDDDELDGD